MAEVRETLGTVVLVGRLNPLIFQPEWLREQQIIGQSEAEQARNGGIEVIHPEVAVINLTAKKLVVDSNRFSISAVEEPIISARDFAMSCFALLPHTPTVAVGINYNLTFRAKDAASWHRLGDLLAPKEPWAKLFPAVGDKPQDREGGLRSLSMERRRGKGEPQGYTRVTVEALETGQSDTKLTVNDHYDLGTFDAPAAATAAVKLLDEHWESSYAHAKELTKAVMDIADGI